MRRTKRQYAGLGLALGTLVLVSATGMGCATRQEPGALAQARTVYRQAEQEPDIPKHAPVALREAEQALQRAERTWSEQQDEQEVQHLAYLATQRIEIARALAQQRVAEASQEQLSEERQAVLREARAREAQQAQQEAARAQEQAMQARQSATQATARASQLERELAALKAKETERGLVLTLGDVLFATGEATLRPGALRNLYTLVTFLKENPTRQASIEGHTDSVGSESYNLDLSQRRAEAVRDFLVQNGIPATQVTSRGYGEESPVASNNTEAGRQQNRRVEVVIMR